MRFLAILLAALTLTGPVAAQAKIKAPTDAKTEVQKLWKEQDAAYDPDNADLKPKVKFEDDGSIIVSNRGFLVTRHEYKKGLTLEFDWEWIKGDPTANAHEHLTVCIRSNALLQKQWAHEADEAYFFKLNTARGQLRLFEKKQGQPQKGIGEPVIVKVEMSKKYSVKVVDTGDRVEFYLDGKKLLSEKVKSLGSFNAGIYTRESGMNEPKASKISKLKISELKK